jgi:hypothetical protein
MRMRVDEARRDPLPLRVNDLEILRKQQVLGDVSDRDDDPLVQQYVAEDNLGTVARAGQYLRVFDKGGSGSLDKAVRASC